MRATLSILGLYSYDKTIFDDLVLPSGVDKQNLISNICLELAELELLYPNADTMKQAISFWSNKNLPVWTKLYATTNLDYNPIYNYDRTETITETETETKRGTHENTRGASGTSSGTASNTNSGVDTVQNDVSAFNEPDFSKKDKQTTTLGTQNSATNSATTTQTDNEDGSTNENNNRENSRSVRAFGNIGVTTTQQMLEAERKIVQFNIVDFIIDDFRKRFCLLIY